MAYKVQFQWVLRDFTPFEIKNLRNESVQNDILSPIFSASSDETSHLWQIKIKYQEKQAYNISIKLMDDPVQKPVSVQYHYEFLDFEDSVFYKTYTALRTFGSNAISYKISDSFTYDMLFKKSVSFTQNIGIRAFLEFKDLNSDFYNLHGHQSYESKLFKQYKKQKYSDLSIMCEGKLFKAHKLIIGSASPIFESLLQDINSESSSNSTLTVDDISSEIFEDILEFIYTGQVFMDYEKAKNLLKGAEKYQLVDLKDMCLCKIENSLSVSTAVEILTIFDEFGSFRMEYFKKKVMNFIKANIADVTSGPAWKGVMLKRVDLMDELIRMSLL